MKSPSKAKSKNRSKAAASSPIDEILDSTKFPAGPAKSAAQIPETALDKMATTASAANGEAPRGFERWHSIDDAPKSFASHSATSVDATIRSLESLAETLPAVLQVANGWAPAGTAFRNRDALLSAIGMLKSWEAMRDREHAREIALGIEQEKNRVKEARRARKH